ncbi:MAG: polysaccharide biosynthesis protein [Sandaracinaceae bacterium]|nr:polysaccharide biosynthesis protein [Sandaracinaceae bacterium]
MRRHLLRLSQLSIDLAVLTLAFGVAFLIRFDWRPPTDLMGRLALTAPYVVLGEYLLLMAFGVPRFSWRYIGLREVFRILTATVLANVLLLWTRLALGELQHDYVYLRHGVIPLGVIAANFALMFLGIAGVRVARRILGEHLESQRNAKKARARERVPTMLVGAGSGGVLMSKEIALNPDIGLSAVGFLDDDPSKKGLVINGVPVLGTTERLTELCARHGARQVLITMASVPGESIRRIARLAEEAELPVKIIPGLYQIASGRVEITRIRPVAIEDLLRREPVALDDDEIADDLEGRAVLVTGAGGSIGSEICRQVAVFRPSRLLLVERAENNLFQIHRELVAAYPRLDVVPLIADVTDADRMRQIFEAHAPSAVFHAAAHKHVPMMEWNPCEAVKNNVFGSKMVADLADEHGTETFVMISTDKAVNPTNVMGASKRVAEMYVQALAGRSKTRFVTVRFGNVLGSAGSVIPIFKDQILKGEPVTVTHPDMTRYFMTIPEACQLVLQAGSMGRGGEIFILDMGEPVKIVDLARDLIRLSGLRPDVDIPIHFTGVRPGEKLFEELSSDAESADETHHPKIFVGRHPSEPWELICEQLERLREVAWSGAHEQVVSRLRSCVPEFVDPPLATLPPESLPPEELTESDASIPGVVRRAAG